MYVVKIERCERFCRIMCIVNLRRGVFFFQWEFVGKRRKRSIKGIVMKVIFYLRTKELYDYNRIIII